MAEQPERLEEELGGSDIVELPRGQPTTRRVEGPRREALDMFAAARAALEKFQEDLFSKERSLEEREAALAEAADTLLVRSRIAKRDFERDNAQILRERETLDELARELVEREARLKPRELALDEREWGLAAWERDAKDEQAWLDHRADEVTRREEQVALREGEVETKALELSERERTLEEGSNSLEAEVQARVAASHQDLLKDLEDLRERLEDSRVTKRSVQAKLQEVEAARERESSEAAAAAEEAEREKLKLLGERREATILMRDVFRRAQGAVQDAGLGLVPLPGGGADTPGHFALGFQEVAERLAGLGEAVNRRLEEEGRELAVAVAEHTLACYRSRDPNFSLEPASQGIGEAGEEEARKAVRGVAEEIAQRFAREEDAGGDESDGAE